MVLLRLGAADIGVLEARKIVVPSGADRATCTAAIAPLAPGLFSMMTPWPSTVESRWPMMRPIRSLPLPGPNGTTKVTGLFGRPCAFAAAPASIRHSTAAARNMPHPPDQPVYRQPEVRGA